MSIRKYDISLDTKVRISNVVIRGRLGDGKGSIVANVTVFNDGQRYNFTGLTPQYEAKLSDGLNIIRDKAGFSAVKAAEGSFTYEFPAELFSAEGYAKASYFTFIDAKGAKQSTFDIAVEVVGMALDGELAETYVSEIDVDLEELTAEVTDATTAANKVIDDIAKNNVVKTADAHFYTDGKGFSRSVPAGVTDWYQISTAGNYSITRTSVPTNAPPVGVYFNLIVNTRTSTTRDLTAINVTTGAIYTNVMTSVNTWSGWVKTLSEIDSVNFQKYSMIPSNGLRSRLPNGTDVLTLKSGYYEVSLCKNSPYAETEASWKNVDVIEAPDGRKDIRLVLNATGNTYFKTLHTNGTGGKDWWQWADRAEFNIVKGTDTGWVTLNALNGVTTSSDIRYRLIDTNGVFTLHVQGTLNSIPSKDVIYSKLPTLVSDKITRAIAYTQNSSAKANTPNFNRLSIETNGDMKFSLSSFNTDGTAGTWNPIDSSFIL